MASSLRAWTIDADDIPIGRDLDGDLLHRTPDIEEFLDPQDTRFFVMGTKGQGKTLLLKAQRLAYQGRMRCLPVRSLIDKPLGDTVFGKASITMFAGSTENWKRVWLLSIACAVLKAQGKRAIEADGLPPALGRLVGDRHLATVMDHFVNVLELPRRELYAAARAASRVLVPRLRELDQPVAVFLDSVDEYLNKHILHTGATDAGELSPQAWQYAQMGLIETAYQLRRLTHHLKIFASIRTEAFAGFAESDPMVQQYRGSTIDLLYSQEELRDIFVSNIRREKPQKLVQRGARTRDPITAFLGFGTVCHTFTGDDEDAFDYIYRHTLGRPRDLMTIGARLSRIPAERRTVDAVKSAVNQAATEIATEYLNEISPASRAHDLTGLFAMMPGNVLPRRTLTELRAAYPVGADEGQPEVFSLLWAAGLVGVVEHDALGRTMQRFERPGRHNLHRANRLPESEFYLVHSALADIIERCNPDFLPRVDRSVVVGDGRPWQAPNPLRPLGVLQADVVGFTEIMRGPWEGEVRAALDAAVAAHAEHFPVAEVHGGDGVMLVHAEPLELVRAARRILEDLYATTPRPLLRIALDYGDIAVARDGGAAKASGQPLRTAARLETRVPPGRIWVTAAFAERFEAQRSLYDLIRPEPPQVDIRKPGSAEPSEVVEVFELRQRT